MIVMKHYLTIIITTLLTISLSSCGFHLQREMPLAPALHRLYLQSPDPYGTLSRNLKQYLKLSKVELVTSPAQAQTILVILRDANTEELLSVNATQKTRQYNLHVTVDFQVTDSNGRIIVPPQSLTETRIITIQSNQILGGSNAAFLLYQDLRRAISYAIMNRLVSYEITHIINQNQPKS